MRRIDIEGEVVLYLHLAFDGCVYPVTVIVLLQIRQFVFDTRDNVVHQYPTD
jgi:hypothetical protein